MGCVSRSSSHFDVCQKSGTAKTSASAVLFAIVAFFLPVTERCGCDVERSRLHEVVAVMRDEVR